VAVDACKVEIFKMQGSWDWQMQQMGSWVWLLLWFTM